MFQLLGLLILRDMLRPLSHLWALLENKAIRKAHKNIGNTSILLKHPTVLAQAAPYLKFELRDVCDLDSSMHQLNFFWPRRNAESSVYGRAKGVLLCTEPEPKLRSERGRTYTAPGLGLVRAQKRDQPSASLPGGQQSAVLYTFHWPCRTGCNVMQSIKSVGHAI
jgi:hypothetical protein